MNSKFISKMINLLTYYFADCFALAQIIKKGDHDAVLECFFCVKNI